MNCKCNRVLQNKHIFCAGIVAHAPRLTSEGVDSCQQPLDFNEANVKNGVEEPHNQKMKQNQKQAPRNQSSLKENPS